MDLVTFHLATLAVTAMAILYADHLGYRYFTGKETVLNEKITSRLHSIVLLGLLLMIMSGILLAAPYWEYWLSQPQFYLKLGLVFTLIMNSWVIGKLYPISTHTPFSELPKNKQIAFLVSGILSFICWVGTTILSFYFL